ncbi:APC family permease [Bacillus sp. AW]|uniref:APC family permease n=1 Tax=Bacillus sp. AW TaxID=2293329 RepID=UPI000E2F2B0B|nr:APC family permease [Bacillus sp. AW]
MNFKSAYFVLAFSGILIIAGFYRFFNSSIPDIVIALISVTATFLSLSDLLEITKFKRYSKVTLVIALISFVVLMINWIYPDKTNHTFTSRMGDGFTVIGFGIVIGLYGIKEILEYRRKEYFKESNEEEVIKPDEEGVIESDEEEVIELDEMIGNYKYELTLNEYKEMMKLNDIIERLKALDQEAFPYNKVHSGWSLFHDSLADYWNKSLGPFFDGANRNIYYDFLCELGNVTEKIGNVADSDNPRTFKYKEVEMWNEIMTINIQPRMNNSDLPSTDDLKEGIDKTLSLWNKLKDLVNGRYETERSNQKKKNMTMNT